MADSSPIPQEIAAEMARADRDAYLEQRLFVLSPCGTLVTSVLIFLAMAASFAGAAWLSGVVVFDHGQLSPSARLALWFSLLTVVILGMQRYSRTRERADFADWSRVLNGGPQDAARVSELTPRGIRLMPATVLGIAIGLAASLIFYRGDLARPLIFAWFALVIILVSMLFTRGVHLTRIGGRAARAMIDNDLKIDLLRVDALAVIGRSSARPALIWFMVSAVLLLQFVGGGLSALSIGLLLACAAMGIWIFVRTMDHVHRRIRSAKLAELERVRGEIDRVRDPADAQSAQILQGLLAYEARIMAAPEWPFDQTTAMRVGASALIVTVPWFGQAVAGYFVEHLAHG